MLNKKAGIAVEEISGIVTFMIFSVLAILIFYGCSISNAKNQYNEIKSLEDEIEANKVLNFFLEMTDDENRKVSDIIVWSYSNNDYDQLDDLANNYFSKKSHAMWGLTLSYEGNILYFSIINSLVGENSLCALTEAQVIMNDLSALKVQLVMNQKTCN